MENIYRFTVEREGDEVVLSFTDLFGEGESYILTIDDARKVSAALMRQTG